MKNIRHLLPFFCSIFAFISISCVINTNTEDDTPDLKIKEKSTHVTENLVETPFEIADWNNKSFNGDIFSGVNEGDTIEIHVTCTDSSYSRVYLDNASWTSYLFSNLTCSPEPNYTSQLQSDTGKTISKISLPTTNEEYTILITLTEDEADALKEGGLLLTGDNYSISQIKLSYTKKTFVSEYSFEDQYNLYAEKHQETIEKYSSKYKLPIICITTYNRDNIVLKEYYDSVIDVVNCDESYELPDDFKKRKAGVKVRGNSTANGNDKPYRIKFDKKTPMLGLHNGKKYKSWVLLKTTGCLAGDYLGFNLAHQIYKTSDFKYYASDARYVHVIVNDVYKGMYLLCEQNQVAEDRVDVTEPEENDGSTKTGYMIELDNYAWEDGYDRWINDSCWKGTEDYHFKLYYKYEDTVPELTDINNVTRKIPEDDFTLKNDIYSDEQVSFIQKYTKGVWDISYAAIEKGIFYKFDEKYNLVEAQEYNSAKEACDAVIDLESLCNEIILEELVRDNDVGAGSLYMAVDFTKAEGEKYNKFTFECPWDFNWAYYNYDNDSNYYADKEKYFAGAWQPKYILESWYEGRSNSWFVLFNKAEWFRQMLREKWERIGTENLLQTVNQVEADLTTPLKEGNPYQNSTTFVKQRIDYIDQKLWK